MDQERQKKIEEVYQKRHKEYNCRFRGYKR